MAAFGGALLAVLVVMLFRRRRLGVRRSRRRAGGLADARRADRPRAEIGLRQRHAGGGAAPAARPAALGVRHRARASRPRPDGARHRRRRFAARRKASSPMQPGETIEIAGYTLRFDGISQFNGPNYTEDQGRFVLFRQGRRAARRDRLGQALLSGAADADDRGRHQDAWAQPALCFAGRRNGGWRRSSCASGGSRW